MELETFLPKHVSAGRPCVFESRRLLVKMPSFPVSRVTNKACTTFSVRAKTQKPKLWTGLDFSGAASGRDAKKRSKKDNGYSVKQDS